MFNLKYYFLLFYIYGLRIHKSFLDKKDIKLQKNNIKRSKFFCSEHLFLDFRWDVFVKSQRIK